MSSSPVMMWTMIILGAALTALKVTAAIWLHRQKSLATWLILIGAVLYAVAELVQLSLMDLNGVYDPERVRLLELSLHAQNLSDFIFIAGFAIFAASLRGERKRIAELEAILRDQHLPLPPVEGQ
jgi:hypothetical protein